jgi:hypothetical protein
MKKTQPAQQSGPAQALQATRKLKASVAGD